MLFSAGLRSKVLLADQRGIEPPPAVNTAAILEWELDIPFTPQDRPPLSIAMIVTVDGARCFRRYRLVIAQKSTASSFFPCSIDREFLYGYAADGYRSPLCYVLPIMEILFWSTGNETQRYIFIRRSTIKIS